MKIKSFKSIVLCEIRSKRAFNAFNSIDTPGITIDIAYFVIQNVMNKILWLLRPARGFHSRNYDL